MAVKTGFLTSARQVVVPENDLEERLVGALMASLAADPLDKERLSNVAIHTGNGTFEAYHPDRFYYLEVVGNYRFVLVISDE